jgi:hypothetical protein
VVLDRGWVAGVVGCLEEGRKRAKRGEEEEGGRGEGKEDAGGGRGEGGGGEGSDREGSSMVVDTGRELDAAGGEG